MKKVFDACVIMASLCFCNLSAEGIYPNKSTKVLKIKDMFDVNAGNAVCGRCGKKYDRQKGHRSCPNK